VIGAERKLDNYIYLATWTHEHGHVFDKTRYFDAELLAKRNLFSNGIDAQLLWRRYYDGTIWPYVLEKFDNCQMFIACAC
jgi:hypothetical protein